MLEDGQKGVILQRDKETYAVAPHMPCGLVTPETLRKIADVAEKHQAAMKITSAARIAIIGLKEDQIDSVWEDLGMDPGAAVGLCVRSIKACPGTGFCKRGMRDSLGLGLRLDKKYHGMELPSKLKIGVSGCPHQCAESSIKDIGLVGSGNGWKVLVGGSAGSAPRMAEKLAVNVSDDDIEPLIEKIVEYYKENGRKNQRLGRMINQMGLDAFKQAIGLEPSA